LSGWAYYALNNTDSALSMAKDLQQSFLSETQSDNPILTTSHQVPKTLAIIDTNAFNKFLAAWEDMSVEMKNVLDGNNDIEFDTALSRTRMRAISFNGVLDTQPTTPSMMDIGHFFEIFDGLCNVTSTSLLRSVIDIAKAAYDDMYVARGVGPGTTNATGMVILWPHQLNYNYNPPAWDNFLFNSSAIFATVASPNWLAFLRAYLNSVTPSESTSTTSVCSNRIKSSIEPSFSGQMFLSPDVGVTEAGLSSEAVFSSDISLETDLVYIYYGLDRSSAITTRRIQEKINRRLELFNLKNSINMDQGSIDTNTSSRMNHHQRRKTQTEDRFYIYGGKLITEYDGPSVTATWDKLFYVLTAGDIVELIYVIDKGNGQKSFPVCYFSPLYPVFSTDLEAFLDTTTASLYLGCATGEITFTISDEMTFVPSLYVLDSTVGTYVEVPLFAGGQIAPIANIELSLEGVLLTEIVGGFNSVVLDWSYTASFGIAWTDNVTADDILVAAQAYDVDLFNYSTGFGFDSFLYRFGGVDLIENGTLPATTGDVTVSPSPTSGDPSNAPTSDLTLLGTFAPSSDFTFSIATFTPTLAPILTTNDGPGPTTSPTSSRFNNSEKPTFSPLAPVNATKNATVSEDLDSNSAESSAYYSVVTTPTSYFWVGTIILSIVLNFVS
jgi:hypothetical protein